MGPKGGVTPLLIAFQIAIKPTKILDFAGLKTPAPGKNCAPVLSVPHGSYRSYRKQLSKRTNINLAVEAFFSCSTGTVQYALNCYKFE
jgi:hypothetical protein